MDLGNTLGVVNLVILLGLLVLGAGAWKGRREVTSETVNELKADLAGRVTVALCDDRHGRSEDELAGIRRQFAPQADVRAVEKTLGSRIESLERTMAENGKTLQAIDQRTARIEGALSRMNGGPKG